MKDSIVSNSQVYLKVILAIFMWGTSSVLSGMLLQYIAARPLSFLRYIIAAIFFISYWVYKRVFHKEALPQLQSKDICFIGIASLFGMFLHSSVLFYSFQYLPVSQVTAILAFDPAVVAFLEVYLFGVILSKKAYAGFLLSFLGVLCIVSQGQWSMLINYENVLMNLLVVFILFFWAIYILMFKISHKKFTSIQFMMLSTVMSALFFSAYLPVYIAEFNEIIVEQINGYIIFLFVIFLITTLVPYIWYFDGIAKIGVSQVIIFSNLMPVVSSIEAMLFLGEKLTLPFCIGTFLVISGITFVNISNHGKQDEIRPNSIAFKISQWFGYDKCS